VALDPEVTTREAEFLFDLFWRGYALPPGRGLWTGGVPGIPVDARYNCHYGTLRSIDDWCWAANMLMCGGGVGIGLQHIDELPRVQYARNARLYILCSKSHPNEGEVVPDELIYDRDNVEWVVVEDSRLGWVEALRSVLTAAFEGRSIVVNVSSIRQRGALIKTFGGIACGPAPLATLLREVWTIVRSAVGHKLTSVDCLDITNHIGVCIKSGNVRRSALIVLGNADDWEFRQAKQDWKAVTTHRHSSNNSIVFEHEWQIDNFNWTDLIEDNAVFGEPGILNLWKIRKTDPGVEGVNPCGEIPLYDREACCLSEIYPAKFLNRGNDIARIFKAVTRYTMRQRLEPMSDRRANLVRVANMRIGVGLGGICDFDWCADDLTYFRKIVQNESIAYANELGCMYPIATTTVKPSGTISLLNGSSPGIHAPFAPYYLRRTRISVNEPMAQALVQAGVPYEQCIYDSTGNTLVFSFPMKSEAYVTQQDQTILDQIGRQVVVQKNWADNSVSSTVSFHEDEKTELARMLAFYAKDLKSISCLPVKHGYEQPPYQAIEESEYDFMMSGIDGNHPLTLGGELDTMECENGVCPIK